MLAALVGTFYALYLGIQARRVRTAASDIRKQLVKGKYGSKHFYSGAGLLVFWTIGSFIGMAATYLLYKKLFLSPHLIGGLGIVGLATVASALVPLMRDGKLWARITHIILALAIIGVSIAQTMTGVAIIGELLQEKL